MLDQIESSMCFEFTHPAAAVPCHQDKKDSAYLFTTDPCHLVSMLAMSAFRTERKQK